MKTYATLFFAILFFLACAPDRSALNKLVEETMQVHDEAMAKMGDMNRLARTLRDELNLADSLALSQGRRDSLAAVLTGITKAEEDMMNWMTNYKEPTVDTKLEEAMQYMTKSKADIDKNYADMVKAIEAAQAAAKQ
ncbi:MAG: hypothetical protein SFV52_14445 [Saprospiraceae bacterium]|nr:hypothetical protein [Saprospiraceae bacterium]